MKIGFDAKRAYHNSTGLGNYSRILIESLASEFRDSKYYLFNPKASSRFTMPGSDNVIQVLPVSRLSKKFSAAWRSMWLVKDLQRLGIDLYHGLSNELPLGIKASRIRSVVTIHDLIFERFPEQYNPVDVHIYRHKFRYACRHADRVIAISNKTKEDIIDIYGINDEKISVCYQSCNPGFERRVPDAEKSLVRENYNLPPEYFLYVGSIIERKNLLGICKAIQLLQGTLAIPLVVIGEGRKYKEKVKEFLRAGDLGDRVIFLSEHAVARNDENRSPGNNFPAIYQMAKALIYPSVYEGFGIPVLEALWSRIPVITSAGTCLWEAAGSGALYVDPYKPDQIAAAMLKACDHQLMQQKVELGFAHAQNFTPEKTSRAVMNVYRELLDQ